jgi:hypothetical protein
MPSGLNGAPELFIDKPPEFSITDDGIGHIKVISGTTEISLRCTPHVLLAGSSAAMRAYVKWDAANGEEPIPFKR